MVSIRPEVIGTLCILCCPGAITATAVSHSTAEKQRDDDV